jgi:hypothetical protein
MRATAGDWLSRVEPTAGMPGRRLYLRRAPATRATLPVCGSRGSKPTSASTWAANALCPVSPSAAVRAVSADMPLA